MGKRRHKYFIRHSVQGKYLRLLVVGMIAPTLLVTFFLLYLMTTLMANQMGIPENIHANLVPVMKQIGLILIIVLPVVICLLFGWGVVLSHRMAGPIFRLQKDLKDVAEGDYERRIIFRKRDDLDELAERVNKVLDLLPVRGTKKK